MNKLDYKFKFASLFHDIGKLIMRIENTRYADHAQIGSKYLNNLNIDNDLFSDGSIIYAVLNHMSKKDVDFEQKDSISKEILRVVKKSDQFSAKERYLINESPVALEDHHPQKIFLGSIFPYITDLENIKERYSTNKDEFYFMYPVTNYFNLSNIKDNFLYKNYPPKNFLVDKRQLYILEYKYFLKSLTDNKKDNYTKFRQSVVELKELAYFLPASSAVSENFISLYSHSIHTSNVSLAIRDKKSLFFIRGEFSHLQKFIFGENVKQDNYKKITSRVRGRSFLIELLTKIFLEEVMNDLDISYDSVILNVSGKFQILCSYSDERKEKLNIFLKKHNIFLFNNFNELQFNIEGVKIDKEKIKGKYDKKNISLYMDELNRNLVIKKNHPIVNSISSLDEYNSFYNIDDFSNLKFCKHCNNIINKERDVCDICSFSEKLGEFYDFPEIFLIISKEKINFIDSNFYINKYIKNLEYEYYLIPREKSKSNLDDIIQKLDNCRIISFVNLVKNKDLLKNKNNNDSNNNIVNKNYLYKYINLFYGKNISFEYNFKTSSKIKSLEDISSIGVNSSNNVNNYKLAYLKMDIDNLGSLYKNCKNFSTIIEFPQQMSYFSGSYLPRIISKIDKDDKYFYTVYIGGDDFYIIGRFDKIFELARDIQKNFNKFTIGKVTISAGLVIKSDSYPIMKATVDVERQLEKSKSREENKNNVKNSISFFNNTFTWEEFNLLLDKVNMFKKKNNEEYILNKSIIYNIYKLMKKILNEKNHLAKLRIRLKYRLGRLFERINSKHTAESANNLDLIKKFDEFIFNNLNKKGDDIFTGSIEVVEKKLVSFLEYLILVMRYNM